MSNWKVFVPQNAVLGGYYAQAINKDAPHPAAARLWEEFLYSQAATGGQNLWLKGGARPVEQAAMTVERHHRHDRGRQAACGQREPPSSSARPQSTDAAELPGGELGEGR